MKIPALPAALPIIAEGKLWNGSELTDSRLKQNLKQNLNQLGNQQDFLATVIGEPVVYAVNVVPVQREPVQEVPIGTPPPATPSAAPNEAKALRKGLLQYTRPLSQLSAVASSVVRTKIAPSIGARFYPSFVESTLKKIMNVVSAYRANPNNEFQLPESILKEPDPMKKIQELSRLSSALSVKAQGLEDSELDERIIAIREELITTYRNLSNPLIGIVLKPRI